MCVRLLESIVPSQQVLAVTEYSPHAEEVVFLVSHLLWQSQLHLQDSPPGKFGLVNRQNS